ncbi:hypothetical protein L873DRAFT_1275265 [Choiromyces venosus 120613-1]|uniref:Uncharacterized protein n=1 Tax=Choiromyces venosus 120613-1 TaxID=1336337 RepID=A0A3N4K843_9PEZI|nr:hypothetical protein L873DRAFT_1275265 [Choiromyces venosus 120613-1]
MGRTGRLGSLAGGSRDVCGHMWDFRKYVTCATVNVARVLVQSIDRLYIPHVDYRSRLKGKRPPGFAYQLHVTNISIGRTSTRVDIWRIQRPYSQCISIYEY